MASSVHSSKSSDTSYILNDALFHKIRFFYPEQYINLELYCIWSRHVARILLKGGGARQTRVGQFSHDHISPSISCYHSYCS